LRIRDYSITKKLTWMNMLVSGAAVLLACTAFVVYGLSAFRSAMLNNLSIQAQMVGANSVSALLFNDRQAAENTLSALRAAPPIFFAGVYGKDGQPLAMYWRDRAAPALPLPATPAGQIETHWFTDQELVLVRSIVFQDKLTGTVYIRSDLRESDDRLRRYASIVAGVLLVSLLAALTISSIFWRIAAQPIVRLAEVARIVSRDKNYSVRAAATSNRDEIAILIEAFNEMLAQIQHRDGALEAVQAELEERVRQRTAALEAINKELETFTYSVAHDLRAPLRHIQGYSDILLEDFGERLDTTAKGYLHQIMDTTGHMGRLIGDLLSLAHVGRQELQLRLTGLQSLLREVLKDLKSETDGRNIQWHVADLPFVECDPGLMKQVLYNLLSNATKYTRPRDPAIIEVGYNSVGGRALIFIRDNGVGFNMKYAGKLFGVFQRLHRAEDFEGTGVGLATVQRIIHKHGGEIWAEAEIEKGATFFFTLAPLPLTAPREEAPALVLEGKHDE
jgi:signal transduction histidine kinase